MPAYSIELPMDHHFWKRDSNSCHYMFEMTFNYDFWIRVTAHPEGNPTISKQININKYNPLLVSLSEVLDNYEDFPEPHLSSYQLHILGELLDTLF